MKKYANLIMLVLCVVFISPVFAQHGHYRDYDRYAYKSYDYKRYVPVEYSYHPYRYYPPVPVRSSVSVIAQLPFGAVAVNFGGRPYHYYNGLYYSPMTGGYMMVEPPMGIVVPVLPPNAVNIIIGGTPYYRYQSVFYLPLGNNGYQVVPEPKAETPKTNLNPSNENYEKFVLDGKTYYKKGSKYFKAKVSDDGEVVYEEVGETSK